MRIRWLLLIALFLIPLRAQAQGVRIGDNPQVTFSPTSGGQLFAVANANISFCSHPANAVPCTNKVTTYTDLTLSAPCPTSTQIVLAGTTTCVSNSDGLGNWGVWVPNGVYDYTIQLPSGGAIGPYTVTLSGSASLLGINNTWTGSNNFTGPLTAFGLFLASINGTPVAGHCASWFSPTILQDSGTSCGGGGGGGAFNTLSSGTNTQAAMVVSTGASIATSGTGTVAATSAPFAGLASGSNTTATMTVGTGASLAPTGSGVLNANQINGTTVTTNAAADQALLTSASATSFWASIPVCLDAAGQHLNYNTATHAFSCGTSGGTAGSAAFNTITNGTNASAAMVVGTGSSLSVSGSGTIAATSSPFSGVTGSTNTTAAMVLGTGSSLTVSGSGTNNANQISATTVPVSSAADQFLGTTSTSVGQWAPIPGCLDAGGNHLNYNTSTHAFSCGTSGGTAGSAAFNTITNGSNTQAAMTVGTGASLAAVGSGTITATAMPFSGLVSSTNTSGTMTVGTGAVMTTSGSGQINANIINGTTVPTNASADQVIGTTGPSVATWLSVPNCLDTLGQHINYNTSTHSFACGTTSSGGGGGAGTVLASPQFQIGSFPNAGSSATVQGTGGITTDSTGNNLNVAGNVTPKGPNPYIDITPYGARAITINTTGTGSGTALTVGVNSFVNGDGITVAQGGAAPVIAAPTGLAVATGAAEGMTVVDVPTAPGMTGSSVYNYNVFAVDVFGGATVPTTTTSIANGPTTLGKTQFPISTWSLTGNTLTIVTSATSGLPVGTVIHITGTTNNTLAGGWYPVATSSGATLTVNNVPQYSATTTSGTGGTVTAFVGNSLTWTRSTGGTPGTTNVVWQYFVCAQRPGDSAFHIIGSSLPSTFYAETNGGNFSNIFVDFGAPLAANPIVPWYLSDANCTAGAAQNELATTTVASGGGTTSLTLAGALSNAVTGVAVREDNGPALVAAENAAHASGGSAYIPIAPGGFTINSPVFVQVSTSVWQAGGLTVNAPIIVGGSVNWFGQTGVQPIPAFGFKGTPSITCNAWPCIYVGGIANQGTGGTTFDSLTLSSVQNGLLFLVDANWATSWNYINFSSGNNNNDNMGMGLVIRPGAASYSINNSNFVGGPNQVIDQTWAPLFFADRGHSGCCSGGGNVGNITMNNTQWNRRGFYYLAFGGDGIHFTSTGRSYSQGGITPRFVAQNTNGLLGGQIELDNVFHDTESQAAYAWICNISCSGGAGVPFHLGFANQVSQDAGTIPGQITGGGNQPIQNIVAGFASGGILTNNNTATPPQWTFQQNRLSANAGIQLLSGDFASVPTPILTLETGTFTDNITSLLTANRTQFMPDASGQVCVTGMVGCGYFVDTGAANAYVITPTNPAISALVDGMAFTIKPANANTTVSTLQVGSTAAATIKKNGISTDLVANDIKAKYDFEVKWDATDSVWLMTSLPGNGGGGGGSGTVNNSAAANQGAYYAGIGTTISALPEGSLSQFEQCVDSGAANAYVCTDTPPVVLSPSAYTRVYMSPINNNTGASTINLDGNGAIPLVKVNSSALIAGDMVAAASYELRCLTTACFVLNPSGSSGTLSVAAGGTGATTASGAFNNLAPPSAPGGLIVANGTNSWGNLGLGANGTTLTSNGITATWTVPTTISGSGVSGQVSYWNGTATQTGSTNFTFATGSGLSLGQGANNTTMLYGSRFTDSVPAGFFQQYQNAAKSVNLYTIDISGNITAAGSVATGTGATTHFFQIPAATPSGAATSTAAFTADASGNGMLSDAGGAYNKVIVSGADVNVLSQIIHSHFMGLATGNIPEADVNGNMVTGPFTDNAVNVASTEDIDLVANASTNECINEVSTGTTNNLLMKPTPTGCIKIGTGDTAIPVYIVQRGGGITGTSQYVTGGQGLCTMDSNTASTRGFFVIASTGTAGQCHAQSAAPAIGTWVVGQMIASSASVGVAAKIIVLNNFYTASGAGTGTVTQVICGAPLTGGTITTIGTCAGPTILLGSSLGAGVVHAPGASQTMTSSAVVGADMASHTITATQLASQYAILPCSAGLTSNAAITAATYTELDCVNKYGVTITITGISCFTDNAGSSTLNVANNAGTGLLTGAVTCNNTKTGGGAAGTQSATTTLAANDALNFTFVADGTSKTTTWTVTYSLP